VRYYKKVGESNADTTEGDNSHLSSKDFVLVLQSETQAQIHQENPRTLCADATHGVTGYLFFLLSLLVINRYGVGFVIAWAIASRENALIWEILARSLRPPSLYANPEVLMTDDDNSAWNGLIRVWITLLHKLLCHWHIKKNVRQHCFGSQSKLRMTGTTKPKGTKNADEVADSGEEDLDPEQVTACVANCKFAYGTPIWQMFYAMMKETDKNTFYSMLEVFRKTCKAYNQVRWNPNSYP